LPCEALSFRAKWGAKSKGTQAKQQKTEKDKNAALQILEALLAKGEQDINVHIRKF
jgi:RNase H-fold protein (predicted Holliday junction resolvase)